MHPCTFISPAHQFRQKRTTKPPIAQLSLIQSQKASRLYPLTPQENDKTNKRVMVSTHTARPTDQANQSAGSDQTKTKILLLFIPTFPPCHYECLGHSERRGNHGNDNRDGPIKQQGKIKNITQGTPSKCSQQSSSVEVIHRWMCSEYDNGDARN